MRPGFRRTRRWRFRTCSTRVPAGPRRRTRRDLTMWSRLKRISLTKWILIAMAIGALIGWQFPNFAQDLKVLSTIFLRMIKSIVAPIIFATLVLGIAGHGDDMKRVGRLALKAIIYFEIVTTIALFIGLAAVNITRPGDGINLGVSAEQGRSLAATTPSWSTFLEHVVPTSIIRCDGEERSPSDRVLVDPVRRRAVPGAGPAQGADARRPARDWPRRSSSSSGSS